MRLPAGDALSYRFVRKGSGTVQNLTVIPKGDRTSTLTSLVSPKAEKAAAEVAAIIRSLDPQVRPG